MRQPVQHKKQKQKKTHLTKRVRAYAQREYNYEWRYGKRFVAGGSSSSYSFGDYFCCCCTNTSEVSKHGA